MATRWQLPAVTLCLILIAPLSLHADIHIDCLGKDDACFDKDSPIPGTEGITPGPGVQLDHRELEYAKLGGWSPDDAMDLTGANFEESNLTNASLGYSKLTYANFTRANLTGAQLGHSRLDYSTLINANLSHSALSASDLNHANLAMADLTGAVLWEANLTNVNLAGAILTRAMLGGLGDMAHSATLTGANLEGAVVAGTRLQQSTRYGFTKEQLYSTASYRAKDLQGIGLSFNDLTGWDFSGQNLNNADLQSTLTNANLSGAVVTGTNLYGATSGGFTAAQLYSTQSYQAKDLNRVRLWANDLTGWDFSGQNLTGARLGESTFTNANLTGANLKNAYLADATGLTSAIVDAGTVYNQWTVFSVGFDPTAAGLTMVMSPKGDLDANDALTAADVDILAYRIRGWVEPYWLPVAAFDMNGDGRVSAEDRQAWVKDVKCTWYGDADLNGEFDSNDFVQVFQVGRYEIGRVEPWGEIVNVASWSEGDWNGDLFFDSADFITAFQDGGYEQGPRTDVATVPEPAGWRLLFLVFVAVMRQKQCPPNRVRARPLG